MSPSRRRAISVHHLAQLWVQYTNFRSSQLAPSTVKRDYAKIARRIAKMQAEAPELGNAITIRDWLLSHYSHETARKTLTQLNACTKWAMVSDIITDNPFDGVTGQLRRPRRSATAYQAFTLQERDRIIQAFDENYAYFSPWVKFLFWTGCRPEEAAALRWEHVSSDYRELLIVEAWPVDMPRPQSTKNYKTTRWQCNARLQRLLRLQWQKGCDRRDFVFPSVTGGRFDYKNFQTRVWRPLVLAMCDRKEVSFYLSQYHARHTFITEGLKAGIDIADMAYLCRVTPEVIYRNYVSKSRAIVVPEF